MTSTPGPDPRPDTPDTPKEPSGLAGTVARAVLGLVVLVLFLGVGTAITDGAGLPVPGSVVGMVLLTMALQFRLIRIAWVRPAADVILRHMGLLFVPPGVAVMVHADLIAAEWLPILAGSAASTVAVLIVVGRMQQWIERDG